MLDVRSYHTRRAGDESVTLASMTLPRSTIDRCSTFALNVSEGRPPSTQSRRNANLCFEKKEGFVYLGHGIIPRDTF